MLMQAPDASSGLMSIQFYPCERGADVGFGPSPLRQDICSLKKNAAIPAARFQHSCIAVTNGPLTKEVSDRLRCVVAAPQFLNSRCEFQGSSLSI